MKILFMSKSKKDIGDKLESGTRLCILHLIKLYLYPNAIERNHWRKEVAEKLNYVDTLKGSHKYPSERFILDNTWNVHKKYLQYDVETILDDYTYTEVDIEALNCAIENYKELTQKTNRL